MGNLAHRYGDAARSGVYAVRDGAVPRAAAAEAGALLLEMPASRLVHECARVERAIEAENARACVVLVPDAGELSGAQHRGVLESLGRIALGRRTAGPPLFVVMVDPGARLGLPPLYKESVTTPAE